MLSIEEILKISNDMGVDIKDNVDNKHYIFNEYGEKVEFNTEMLMDVDEKKISNRIELQFSDNYTDGKYSINYNLVNSENPYVSKSIDINESIIDAA